MDMFTTMITPYKPDGTVDYDTACRYVDWYFENGLTGIFAVCQSSEIFFLSLEERVKLNRCVYERAKALEKESGRRFTVVSSGHISDSLEDQATELNAIWESGTDAQLPVKSTKKQRKTEDMTVFILSCDGKYAVQKRPASGLLADLWQFPNLPGHLEPQGALAAAEQWGLHPRTLHRQVLRKHIFTHIQWQMLGYYLEVADMADGFVWLTADEVNTSAALPTAFRQFWEEISNV